MKKTVELLDFCLPYFFSGYPKPVIAISVYGKMTQKEIGEAIKDEVNNIYDYLESGYSEDEIKLIEEFAESLINNSSQFKDGFDPGYDVEIDEDLFEPAYLCFAVCEMTYSNGMRFLNP